MHLSTTTTTTTITKTQHSFHSYVHCWRACVRACVNASIFTHYINILRSLSHWAVCLSSCLLLLLLFILFPFIYVCFVFTLCQYVFPARAKNWPRNKIPINVKTNVLLMYVMKRNFFFLLQLFLPSTINSFRIQYTSIDGHEQQ